MDITRTIVETRRIYRPIAETLIEPQPRKVGYTAIAVEVTQRIENGHVSPPVAFLVGYPTKRNGDRTAYRGIKRLSVVGSRRFDLEYNHTDAGTAVADTLAADALREFEAIDWETQQS